MRKVSLARVVPYAILVAAALAATWRLFATPGMPYNVDISGFFPLTPDTYERRFWPLWNEGGGMATLQFLPALLFELPLLVLGKLLAWDMAVHIKVRILLGFALAGVSMYALARYYVGKHARGRLSAWAMAAIPLGPALFFMFNPWSVHRVFHYFLWLGYALAPLLILALERLADEPTRRRALVFGLAVAVATTDPHNPFHFAILLAPFGLLRLAQAWRRSGVEAWTLAKRVLLAAGAYALLAAYWVLPYVVSLRANPSLGPAYVMSDEMLGVLSRAGSFPDTLRLLHNYNPRASFAPGGGLALVAWEWAGFGIAAGAFAAAIVARRGIVWVYAGVAVVSVALGMGANPPVGGFYAWLLFDAPWGESLGWLFRDPFRWGGFQALAYAALLTFLLVELAAWARFAPRVLRAGLQAAPPSAALACAALFVLPGVGAYMTDVYDPVVVPAEYAETNAYLATTPVDEGVVWMPKMLGATTWSGNRTMAYFDATSSARAALGPFRTDTNTYFRFLEDAAKDGAALPPLLARAGVERVVFHNDRVPERDATTIATLQRVGLDEEARFGNRTVRVVDQSAMAFSDTSATRVNLNGTQEIVQTFVPEHRSPAKLSIRAVKTGDAGGLEVTILRADNTTLARRHASEPTEGAAIVGLAGLRFEPGSTYQMRLRAPSAENGTRWEVSCYTVDTYASGAVLPGPKGKPPCAGDVAFELQAVTRGFVTTLVSERDAPRLRATTGALASPGGLATLRALSAAPEGSDLATAGIVFTSATESARRAFADADADAWTWVAGLDDTRWEAVVPYLPATSFVAPFEHTTSADGKAGWARGTRDFTYYEWGWSTSLAALKQESWDFEGTRGLVYTSANATLEVPMPVGARDAPAVVLARVYEHAKGGNLRVEALGAADIEGTLVGGVRTRDAIAGFRWVEIGSVPAGTRALRLVGDGSFLGLSQLAVVTEDALAAAQAESAQRFARTPVVMIAQAESVPGLNQRALAQPGVGRFASINRTANVSLTVPADGDYALWVRLLNASPVPNASIDGAQLGALACVADCDGATPWFATPRAPLAAGHHTLAIVPTQPTPRVLVDAIALTNAPAGLFGGPAPVDLAWERIDATRYEASLDSQGPVALVLAQPPDAGWVARLDDGRVVRGVPVDGVANAFLFDADGATRVVVEYEPQPWAVRGAWIAAFALLAIGMLLVFDMRARVRVPAPVPEDSP